MKKLLLFLLLLPALAFSQQIVTLDGSGSLDPDGSIASYRWKLISGPAAVVIADSTKAITTASIPFIAGDYKFQLTVTDNLGLQGIAFSTVSVIPNPDVPPIINAGSDQTIQLSATVNKITLVGAATDPNGNASINLTIWSVISGPNTPTFTAGTSFTTDVTNIVAGTYKFRLKVGDNGGASAADTVQVIVKPSNVAPTSNAGPNQTVTLPVISVTIGQRDPTGLQIFWSKVSGPSGGNISNPYISVTQVSNLHRGTYVFQKVTRNGSGQTATSRVTIRVKKNAGFLIYNT